MKKENVFLNKYIKGIALAPFYVFTALLVSALPIYIWLFIVVFLLFISGSVYDVIIDVKTKSKGQLLLRYSLIIIFQLVLIATIFVL